jgi:hypothetical protein
MSVYEATAPPQPINWKIKAIKDTMPDERLSMHMKIIQEERVRIRPTARIIKKASERVLSTVYQLFL